MDLLSVLGLALAVGGIIAGQLLEGGHPGSLAQGAALVIVFGGTFGAVMLQHPWRTFRDGIAMARWVFVPPPPAARRLIEDIADWGAVARRDGLLALERRVESIADPFVRRGLQLLVDGVEPDRIRDTLEVELEAFETRLGAGTRVWEAAGGYAPTVGIIGAVLGLIHVMENLNDPSKLGGGIATAFVATVYGVGLANLVCLPFAAKLKQVCEAQVRERELVLDGLLAIANGENPRLVQSRLEGYFS
jgi:chemotaxis protein MotA